MIKIAIFVEGQTELILVREFLLKWYEYTNISLNCFNQFKTGLTTQAEYEFTNPDSAKYFQIVNVGNDNAVLQRILDNEKSLFKKGYSKIIGLRDMYGKSYRKAVKGQVIDELINHKFIQADQEEIEYSSSDPKNIYFHYAIMEVEAWLWGLKDVFQKIDQRLSKAYIIEKTGFDIEVDDPETAFFHPSPKLTELLSTIGKSYNKSKADVNSFVSYIDKTDYQNLLDSEKCGSFKDFFQSVVI